MKRLLTTALLVLLLFGTALAEGELWTTEQGRARVFDALVQVVRDNYWDEDYLDWELWAARYRDAAVHAESRPAFDVVLRRMVRELQDDHSSYLGFTAAPQSFVAAPRAPELGFRYRFLAGQGLVIERVFPQTPAAAAGLHRGDVVIAVNGHPLDEVERSVEASDLLIEARAGGEVTLELRRDRATFVVTVVPEVLESTDAADLPQAEMLDATTGYLYLPSFRLPGVAAEVHRLLAELQEQGATSLVLDLRGNLGGRLGELGLVLGAFIEGPWAEAVSRGTVVWQGRYELEQQLGVNILQEADGGTLRSDDLTEPVRFTGPLAVLVDRHNSSAGEIAALVLQNLGRAVVIGEPTAGNVEAVQGFDLPDGSVVMVAVANLQGIDGSSFSGGVQPDVLAREELSELARGYDAPVAEALRALHRLPFRPGKFF